MVVVEKTKSKSKKATEEMSERMRAAHVPHGQRKSKQKYSSHLKPKKVKGSEPIKYSRHGSESPRYWFVTNSRFKPEAGSTKKWRKVKVKAVTPRKAARHAMDQENWGTNVAYVGDGRGKGVVLGFVRRFNHETGRRQLMAVKGGKPYEPSENAEYLSSSEGSEEGSYDAHERRVKRKYVKSGKYSKKSGAKSGVVTEKGVAAATKTAVTEAGAEAPDGQKRVAKAAAKEAVQEVLAAHPEKVAPSQAKKIASKAKKIAVQTVKEATDDKAAAKAAGDAAQHAVEKAVAPRRSGRLAAK